MGIDFQTKGQLRPTIPEIRDRMNREGFQVTDVLDAQRCVTSYDHIPGRRPLTYAIVNAAVEAKEAVAKGKYVHCCIHYGVFNRLMSKTGDPDFSGGHSVGVVGQKRLKNGEIMWLLFDPLDDARRSNVPQGPRWVKREAIVKSMEAFAGSDGRVVAGVFGGGQKR